MKYIIEHTGKFKKDFKLAIKRGYNINLLKDVVNKLANGEELEEKYKDHFLTGNYKGYRECHILPDWLLIYRTDDTALILVLTETGTHSDLFGK